MLHRRFACLAGSAIILFTSLSAASAATVKVLSWNLLRYDPPGTGEYQALTRIVQAINPDIILLQEAVDAAGRSSFIVQFATRYPYHYLGLPTKETVRNEIVSAFPLRDAGEIFAEDAANPGQLFERPTIWADVDVDSDGTADMRVYSAHYKSGSSGTDAETREHQAIADTTRLASFLTHNANAQVFYAGDLNAEPNELPLTILANHLTRLFPVDPNNGSPVTRPASGKTIDYLHHSAALTGQISNVSVFNTATGPPPAPALSGDSATASDHLCLRAELNVAVTGNAYTPGPQDVRINEVFADHDGNDLVEFVELHGPAGIDLSSLTLLIVEGDVTFKGTIDRVWSLAGQTMPADGLFVLGKDTTPHVDLTIGTSNTIENGTNTFLLVQGFTGNTGDDVDSDNDGAADAGYTAIGTIIDHVGLSDGGSGDSTYYAAPTRGPVTRFNQTANSAGLARKCNGLDRGTANDWAFSSWYVIPPDVGVGSGDGFLAASPGVHNAYASLSIAPLASDGEVSLTRTDAPSPPAVPIVLEADDSQAPGPDSLSYIITALAGGKGPTPAVNSGGTLIDPDDDTVIATVPYTLKNGGNVVHFRPATGATGWFAPRFKVSDGASDSAEASLHLFIQDTGPVVITEIMYDPSSRPDPTGSPAGSGEADWEWIEIHNFGATSVTVQCLLDGDLDTQSNLVNQSIPAETTQVIAKSQQSWWTLAQFLSEWAPLSAGSILQMDTFYIPGAPKLGNGGDVLRLFDASGKLLDQVTYRNGADGWPTSSDMASIHANSGKLTTTDNDLGANWSLSQAGVNNAYATPDSPGDPADSDVGSPAILPPLEFSEPPVAYDGQLQIDQGSSPGTIIDLAVTDPDTPVGNLQLSILSAPTGVTPTSGLGGALTDPNNAETVVTGGGTLAGSQVRFTPAPGISGVFAFTFKANDGAHDSNIATITVAVQGIGRVVITEIMYNPRNSDTHWEWIEIHNLTASPVALHTLYDANNNTEANLVGLTLPASGTAVIAKGDISGGRSLADFLTEWSPLSGPSVLPAVLNMFPTLNNVGGDTLRLFAADGTLLDVVVYEDNTNGWPNDNGESSVYLLPGSITTSANDIGSNWAIAQAGIDGAYATPETPGDPLDSDIGSPGYVNTQAPAPTLTAAVSRKTHSVAGPFDLNVLSLSGIENRSGGPTRLVVTFSGPIQAATGTPNDVSVSTGSVTGMAVNGSELTVDLAGTTDGAVLTVGFPGIAAAGSPAAVVTQTLCLGVLAGDANGDRSTNIFDLIAVRNVLNHTVPACP